MNLRKLTRDDVTIKLECLEEDSPVDGFLATDEPEKDREDIAEIKRRRASGDEWAWFMARVTASWEGFEASDTLGMCSYASEVDFRADGQFDEMVDVAIDELNAKIAKEAETLTKLVPVTNMNGLRVAVREGTLFVVLPRALWRPAGPCRCAVCQGRQSFWDTLAVSTNESTAWMVHKPELHPGYADELTPANP